LQQGIVACQKNIKAALMKINQTFSKIKISIIIIEHRVLTKYKDNMKTTRKHKHTTTKNNHRNNKPHSTNKNNMNYKANISADELMNSLMDFIQKGSYNFTLFLMGETDNVCFPVNSLTIKQWLTKCQPYLGSDYYMIIQQLGFCMDKNVFEKQISIDPLQTMIFYLKGLLYFLQSDTYKNLKGTFNNRTVIITFFNGKKGYYFPHVIGATLAHPASPDFLSSAMPMIKLCVRKRQHVYDSLAVKLMLSI